MAPSLLEDLAHRRHLENLENHRFLVVLEFRRPVLLEHPDYLGFRFQFHPEHPEHLALLGNLVRLVRLDHLEERQ